MHVHVAFAAQRSNVIRLESAFSTVCKGYENPDCWQQFSIKGKVANYDVTPPHLRVLMPFTGLEPIDVNWRVYDSEKKRVGADTTEIKLRGDN